MLLEVYYTRSDLAEVDDGDLTATDKQAGMIISVFPIQQFIIEFPFEHKISLRL